MSRTRTKLTPDDNESSRDDATQAAPGDKQPHPRFPPHSLQILLALLAYRLAYLGAMWLSTRLLPSIYLFNNYNINHIYEMHGQPELLWHIIPWDAGNYISLSVYGYGPVSVARAFYPLWPGLIWVFTKMTGASPIIVGEILANVITIAASYVLYWFVWDKYGETVARRTTVLTLAFPGAVFLSVPYSEPLFLLLSAMAILALQRNRSWIAGIAGFLAALSRPTGVLWAIPMAADLLIKKRYRELWTVGLPVAGFGVYLLLMRAFTGDAFSGFGIQSVYIAHSSMADLLNPVGFVKALFTAPNMVAIHLPLSSPIDRLWFILALPLLCIVYRQDKTAFWYALLMMIVPAVTVKFMSFTRYAEMLFPLFVVVAQRSLKTNADFWYPVLVAAFFLLQILFLLRQINYFWV